ncbi:hypothetical protein J6590_003888 [Homalodisca vitripennis]|nr:hypothetical protein J6590_003888 [Homalodisca vitripennis]
MHRDLYPDLSLAGRVRYHYTTEPFIFTIHLFCIWPFIPREVRAKKPSLTLNLGTNALEVTSEPPPMAGQAGQNSTFT